MKKNTSNYTVRRDTTPNSTGEIVHRFGMLAMGLSLALAPILLFLALIDREGTPPWTACGFGVVGLGLWLTRRWWKLKPAEAEAGAGAELAETREQMMTVAGGTGKEGRPKVLLLNASLAGGGGNSARMLAAAAKRIGPEFEVCTAALAGGDAATFATLEPVLRECVGMVIATGTHWDGWSSPLQKFLEDATPAEASALWLGKPVAVLVTEHSTGGKAVLSRLQGVLVTLGCEIPPLSGLVLSQAVQLARRHTPDPEATEDYWSPADLDVVMHNLLQAVRRPALRWKTWPVDRQGFARAWLELG